MVAEIINCTEIAKSLEETLKLCFDEINSKLPYGYRIKLATFLPRESEKSKSDEESVLYRRSLKKYCDRFGIRLLAYNCYYDAKIKLENIIKICNRDPFVIGELLFLPLPDNMKDVDYSNIIKFDKDVEGLSDIRVDGWKNGYSEGRIIPATALAAVKVLEAYDY